MPYVLATRNDDLLTCPDGHREQAKVLATLAGVDADGRIDPTAWERRSLGYGAHGERVYDWTAVALDPAGLPDGLGPLAAGAPAGRTHRRPDRGGQDRAGAGLLPLRRTRARRRCAS